MIQINGHKFEMYPCKNGVVVYCTTPEKKRMCIGHYESNQDAAEFILCFVADELGYQLKHSTARSLLRPA